MTKCYKSADILLSQIVNEMASAAGLACDIDPALCAALRAQKSTKDIGEDDYNIGIVLLVTK